MPNNAPHNTPNDFKIISECWDEDRGIVSGSQPKDVEQLGYGKPQGGGPHLCIDIPDGESVIVCRNSKGELFTISMYPTIDEKPCPTAVMVKTKVGRAILDINSLKR